MNYRGFVLVVLLCSASIAACATITTKVTAVWKNEAYKDQPKRLLVIVLFPSRTGSMMVEDAFLVHLKSRRVDAAASYDVFSGDELPTREKLVEQVKDGGYDAVLMTRVINARIEQRTEQRTPTYMAPHYGMPMSVYYDYAYSAVYTPLYKIGERDAKLESNLYDAATEKLIWTATSDTKLSGAEQELIQTFVGIMVESLRKEKLVP
jgi:hypothetical protein